MKAKRKLLFILAAGLLSGASSVASASSLKKPMQADADKQPCLVVKMQAGGENVFFLEGSPKLMYFADSLAVVYDKQQLNFSLKDLKDYHFEERKTTGIGKVVDQNKSQGETNFVQGLAIFTQYPAGTKITVFTSNGRQVAKVITDKEGRAQLDLRDQPAGVYVITAGQRSFKWLKK
ncbi:Ig-like domain-containing protein [Alloprevotella tannerae]|uniref:Ig-like domain-containing protein n=1 Tax=Alloprevotella tannerae TaxID=76122 RepID=UPI00241DCD84|nr:Ig-like domain-containing protein [Alloprevotella tannerae]